MVIDITEINQKKIYYSEGYKYQLKKDYCLFIGIRPKEDIITEYVCLCKNGLLYIKKGYAWDDCSGPTYDDKTNMRAGLVHDAGYQLLRLALLDQKHKAYFDQKFKEICIEDKMLRIRAGYYYFAVDKFGGKSCSVGYTPYPILEAP